MTMAPNIQPRVARANGCYQLADGHHFSVRSDGCTRAGRIHIAGILPLNPRRSHRRQLQPPTGDVCGALPDSVGINDADDFCGTGICQSLANSRIKFPAGCGFASNDPAWHASVGDILPKRDIPAAVTLMSVGYNIVRSVGPALGVWS